MMIDIIWTLRHFAREKKRNKDSSSNSSSWKALGLRKFIENWQLYPDLQLIHWPKSKNSMPASMRATFHATTNSDLIDLLAFWRRLSPMSLGVSCSDCKDYCARFQPVYADSQKDPPMGAGAPEVLRKVPTTFALRRWKSRSHSNGN
jgi:hypothetical protein